MICTFFGHRECYGLNEKTLERAIDELIRKGVDTFYVGHQGNFDSMVLGCLKKLKEIYSNISFTVVLAYMPTHKYDLYNGYSIYPEGLEIGLPKFSIERRNKWMIDRSDYCLCYVDHTRGGAYKFVKIAKNKGVEIINLGSVEV
ncbi:MAG: DUF1273 domain-containing protein [Clostridia bacterium]|nr:DUF1273 domain-containing protein [Clostridia bacterium]